MQTCTHHATFMRFFTRSNKQNEFVLKKKAQGKTKPVHTGTIWATKDAKKPDLLSRKIWHHVRVWQWCWQSASVTNLSCHTPERFAEKLERPCVPLRLEIGTTGSHFQNSKPYTCRSLKCCAEMVSSDMHDSRTCCLGSKNNPPGCLYTTNHN